jgi:peroxiredoxin
VDTKSALRTAAIVVAVVATAFGYARLADEGGPALRPGTAAPDLRLPSLAGGEVDLAAYRGRVVLLNFWATWCPPCVAEMPSLERLHRALGPEGLAVVTVSADDDVAGLRDFVKRNGITLPVLLDPDGRVAGRAYGTTAYPETFVLDGSGILLQHYVGPARWDAPEALAHFRNLLHPRVASR